MVAGFTILIIIACYRYSIYKKLIQEKDPWNVYIVKNCLEDPVI